MSEMINYYLLAIELLLNIMQRFTYKLKSVILIYDLLIDTLF